MGAYQAGALFLEPQIKTCISELIEIEGYSPEFLPQINFIKIMDADREIIET